MKGVDASSGSLQNLQVHHLKLRSRSGGDMEQNLITLSAECHEQMHRKATRCRPGCSDSSRSISAARLMIAIPQNNGSSEADFFRAALFSVSNHLEVLWRRNPLTLTISEANRRKDSTSA